MGRAGATLLAEEGAKVVVADVDLEKGRRVTESIVGKRLADAVVPRLGFLFCLAIWLNLPAPAKMVGGAWFLVGLAYDAIQTRGFRRKALMIDFGDTGSGGNP